MTTFPDSGVEADRGTAREQFSELARRVTAGSRRVLTPAAGMIATAAVVLLLTGLYAQGRYALDGVNEQIEGSRRLLAAQGAELPSPDEQLLAWQTALDAALTARVDAPVDSEFVQSLLNTALDSGVRLVTASAQADAVADVEGAEYGVTPYLVRVEGPLANVQTFLRKLEGGLVEALEVDSAIASREVDTFLLSVGLVVRNELPAGDGQGSGTPSGPAGEARTVGVNTGVRR